MANELVIKYDNLELLVQGGKSITMNPQGEELLIKLLELRDKVEFAITQCKNTLTTAITEIDPDLTSISSDRVKVMYRVYGAKYGLNDILIDELDPKFYIKKEVFSPNAKEIDNHIKATGVLPNGIMINDRSKTVSISLKGSKDELTEIQG
jgi:hypothetical protein